MSNLPPESPYTPPPPPTGSAGGELIYPTTPPKDPVLVLVLNLLVAGGVGYLIMGQKVKGIVAIVAWVLGLIFTCGAASGLVAIVAAVDGYLQAQQLQAGHPVGPWTFFNDHR